MKKGLLMFVIIGIILFITLIGIIFFIIKGKKTNILLENTNKDEKNYINQQSTIERVTMTIKDGTLNKDGAVVVIKNNDENPFGYDEWFRIDKKNNEKWEELKPINSNYVFYSLAYIIEGKQETEIKVDWSKLYGKLKDGRYRLVKHYNDSEYFAIEFTIK